MINESQQIGIYEIEINGKMFMHFGDEQSFTEFVERINKNPPKPEDCVCNITLKR